MALWYSIKDIILKKSIRWPNLICTSLIFGVLTMIFCLIIQDFFLHAFGLQKIENIILENLFISALLLVTIEPTLNNIVLAITRKKHHTR